MADSRPAVGSIAWKSKNIITLSVIMFVSWFTIVLYSHLLGKGILYIKKEVCYVFKKPRGDVESLAEASERFQIV